MQTGIRLGVIVIAVLAIPGVGEASADPGTRLLPLSEGWRLQSSAKVAEGGAVIASEAFTPEGWYGVTVPTTVLAALVANGVYPDPYYGDNITKIPGYQQGLWLVMAEDSPFRPSWWYRVDFEVPKAFDGQHVVLHFDGINYRANIWLNGQQIAGADTVRGMFRRFEFDVNGVVKAGGPNVLAVEIFAPGDIPKEQLKRTKQLEATTGWDDHNPQPPDLNMGIWEDVCLTASGPAALRHAYVDSDLEVPSLAKAALTASVYAQNKTSEPVSATLTMRIEDIVCEQAVELAPGEAQEVILTPEAFPQLTVENPRVWWPAGLGPQELYEADFALTVNGETSDTAHVRFGIRKATTSINAEGWRAYHINGGDVLIRGGAWMTSDMLLRLTPRRYEALVRYAREGHLNMLRSEGFSIRETEEFYNLCDEYGIMVTQQIFGRNLPDEELAVACVDDMMLRVRTHPSLVHFLGHDETFPTETLGNAYQDIMAKYRVNRTYQPHSGAFELDERFETGGTRTGSLKVWMYGEPNHYYISEATGAWGFAQSGGIGGVFACVDSMRRMMPEEALWPPFTGTWSLHTVTQGGSYFNLVVKAIHDRYGKPEGIEDFIKKGFMLNYECARGMFEAYGRNKFSSTGITTWKYDAAWPASPTWQYVDWYLNPTGAYYGAKKACEPVHVQYSYDDDSVYVVNNLYEDLTGLHVDARLYNLDMSEKYAKAADVEVPSNGKINALTIYKPTDLSPCHFLRLRLSNSAGEAVSDNFYWLSTSPDTPRSKEMPTWLAAHSDTFDEYLAPASVADYTALNQLPKVELDASAAFGKVDGESAATVTLRNPTEHLAFFIRLALRQGHDGHEVTPIYWDENCFSLMPGEERVITGRFAEADLDGAKPVVLVEGWNVGPATP